MRLADLGTVEDGWSEPRQSARLNGREIVAFAVFRAVGSSEVDVTRKVLATVEAMNAASKTAHIQEVTSTTGFVLESYDASLEAPWIVALLAIGVVWIFLRDLRATLAASAVADPDLRRHGVVQRVAQHDHASGLMYLQIRNPFSVRPPYSRISEDAGIPFSLVERG